jgi:hypothetical protein
MLNSNSMDIAMEKFVFSMDTTKGKGRVKGRGSMSSQHNSNWSQDNVLELINYKHKDHNTLK